jgi:YHS domain-containing protein
MGGKIDSTYYTDIQGQRVYHCCPKCSAKLKADPDKYFKKAAADGVLFQNIQKICPVSGEDLESAKFYTDYQGRRILFCCNKCKKSFASNPTKYLAMMDQPADSSGQKDEKMDMHEGK